MANELGIEWVIPFGLRWLAAELQVYCNRNSGLTRWAKIDDFHDVFGDALNFLAWTAVYNE
jgi:hypothetical protein